MRLIYIFTPAALLAAGAKAMGTSFTFYDDTQAEGEPIGEKEIEPAGPFKINEEVCVWDEDGREIQSVDVAEGSGITWWLGFGAGTYSIRGFDDDKCEGKVVEEFIYSNDKEESGVLLFKTGAKSAKVVITESEA